MLFRVRKMAYCHPFHLRCNLKRSLIIKKEQKRKANRLHIKTMKAILSLGFWALCAATAQAWIPPLHGSSIRGQSRLFVTSETSPKKMVVVGGGIGGLSTAFDARKHLNEKVEIHVVSDRATFQFTPSNPWIGVRKRSPQDISLELSSILKSHGIAFHHTKATSLNPTKNQLKLEDGDTMTYDYLVIATGPRLAFEEVPGTGPDGYSTSICTTPHASEAAKAVDALVANPGPIVIGAVQGASCFGPAYEFALLLNNALHKRGGKKLVESCKITFITPEPYIGHLGLKGAGESKEILERRLALEGISWITNCMVKKVEKESVSVEYVEKTTPDGKTAKTKRTLPSKFTMLIPAFRGGKLWGKVKGLTDDSGMILVNKHQQSPRYPNIFSVGICTHLDRLETTLVPTGAPKTGYMIESMGTATVENIGTMIDKQTEYEGDLAKIPLKAIPTLNGLCITDFGDDGAIFLTLPQLPPRRTEVTINGRIATLAKLAFEKYFMYKVETGDTDPYYEKHMLKLIGVERTEPSTK